MIKYLFFNLSQLLKIKNKFKSHFDTSCAIYENIEYILKRYTIKIKKINIIIYF